MPQDRQLVCSVRVEQQQGVAIAGGHHVLWQEPGAELDGVVAPCIVVEGIDGVHARTDTEQVGIVARAADQQVIAQPAVERVIAPATIDGVATPQAIQRVIRLVAVDRFSGICRLRQPCVNDARIPHRAVAELDLLDGANYCPDAVVVKVAADTQAARRRVDRQHEVFAIARQCHVGWRHACLHHDGVERTAAAVFSDDRVLPGAEGEEIGVVAGTTHERVVASAAVEHVIACGAVDAVASAESVERVIESRAQQLVVLLRGNQELLRDGRTIPDRSIVFELDSINAVVRDRGAGVPEVGVNSNLVRRVLKMKHQVVAHAIELHVACQNPRCQRQRVDVA